MVAYRSWSVPVPRFAQHPGLALVAMVLLVLLTCLLTWRDPIVRAGHVPPGPAIAGWASMAALPALVVLFGDAGSATTLVWGIAALYALSILTTLGRPLLIFSDLLDDAESKPHVSASDRRRSRIGQILLICGICAVVIVTA